MHLDGRGPKDPPDPLLTVRRLAEIEGYSERTVRHLIFSHGLPVYRAGGVRVRWSEYMAWLETRRRR
jgi:hypothetical protein